MRKSVLLRHILLLILAAVLLSGLMTAGIYIFVTQNRYVRMRADELKPIAHTVASMMTDAMNEEESIQGIWPLLRRDNKDFLGALLHIYNAKGESMLNPSPLAERPPRARGQEEEGPLSEEGGLARMIAKNLDDVLSGREVSEIRGTDDGKSYLVVGVPIVNDGEVVGAVVFTKSTGELSEAMRGLNSTLLISTFVSFLIMWIPAYFLVKRLVVPIRQMERVARAMAKGDFSVRADEVRNGEIGELARSMNHFARESERLEQTRRDYVANVSHELRTPIAAIRAMGETLRDGMAKSEEKRGVFYGNIVGESLRLSRLVDDLLELSRLQSGRVAMKKGEFDVRELVRNVTDTYRYVAGESGLRFELEVDFKDPILVCSNQDRMEQVLVILLDNAMKFTEDGGRVGLSVKEGEDRVRIGVCNSGAPIREEDLPHLFERFYKADESHSGAGTGLGLSIAKEIMDGLGEDITVESDESETKFWITIGKGRESCK